MRYLRNARATILVLAVTILAAVLILASAGCGGNTPTSAAQDMINNLSNRDFGAAYDSFSSTSPIRQQVNRDDFVTQMGASLPDGTTITDFNVTDEQIDGDKATVKWQAKVNMPNADPQSLDDKFDLVKEDDTWKIDQ